MITDDRNDPRLKELDPDGQQKAYLVLSEEERQKGFVRPLRRTYKHLACGTTTTMGWAIAETYAKDPTFYGGTYCVQCRAHFNLVGQDPTTGEIRRNFVWIDDETGVGE